MITYRSPQVGLVWCFGIVGPMFYSVYIQSTWLLLSKLGANQLDHFFVTGRSSMDLALRSWHSGNLLQR